MEGKRNNTCWQVSKYGDDEDHLNDCRRDPKIGPALLQSTGSGIHPLPRSSICIQCIFVKETAHAEDAKYAR